MTAQRTHEPRQLDKLIDAVEAWRYRPDPLAAGVGFKFVLDGGLEPGRRVGTHAYGDRAVWVLIDVYERVWSAIPGCRRARWLSGTVGSIPPSSAPAPSAWDSR